MENLIGKEVLVTVAFAGGLAGAGSLPEKFVGVFEKIDGDFFVFSNIKVQRSGFTSINYVDYGNSAIINKQYIVVMVDKM